MAPMAEASCSGRRRFAVACSVLSRCVRAEAEAAAAGKVTAPAPAAPARSSSPTMLLMPGADVVREEEEEAAAEAPPPAHQLTIMYGGRALVFDDVPADTAAKLMRVAVAARRDTPHGLPADLQVARKASLQRLMEKRQDRLAARAPYAAPDARPAVAAAAPKGQEEEGHAASWLGLGLGIQGGSDHRVIE
ncbi:hypothetical protein BS78_01G236000 [Paspalum vaginatum]|nr:hypothetical protein BS78_01G236000 [Paspalum vaginatum]